MSEWIDITLQKAEGNADHDNDASGALRRKQNVERGMPKQAERRAPRLPGMEDFPQKAHLQTTKTKTAKKKMAENFLRPTPISSLSPQRDDSPVTECKLVDSLEIPNSSSNHGNPIPREKLPVRVQVTPTIEVLSAAAAISPAAMVSPLKQQEDAVDSDDDAVLGMVRRVAVGHWQVRTPDGTILDSSFPTSESAHMALAALDEMRRKKKKLKQNKDLPTMPERYYKENRNHDRNRRPAKRSRSRSKHNRKRRFRSRSPRRPPSRSGARRSRRQDSPSPPPPLRRRTNRNSRSYSDRRRSYSRDRRQDTRKRGRTKSRDRDLSRYGGGMYSDGGYRSAKRRRGSSARRRSHRQPVNDENRHRGKGSSSAPFQTIAEMADDTPKVFGPEPPGGEAKKKWKELRNRSPSREDVREREPQYVEQVPIRKQAKNFITSNAGKPSDKPKRPIIIDKRVNREVLIIQKEPTVVVQQNFDPNLEREKRRVEMSKKLIQRTKQIQLKQLKSLLKKSMKQNNLSKEQEQVASEEVVIEAPPTKRTEEEVDLLRQKALASMRNRRTVQLTKTAVEGEETTGKVVEPEPSPTEEGSVNSDSP